MNLRDFSSVKNRREAIEKELQISLNTIGSYSLDEQQVASHNCENMIGIAQVPLGIAGPLNVRGKSGTIRTYYVPLATTEAALVASVNRGCKAITESGSAISLVERVGVTRAPVFKVKNMLEGIKLQEFVKRYFDTLKKEAGKISSHLKLIKGNIFLTGAYVFIRLYFDTADAMGMNMATIATQKIVERIEKETGISCLTIAGNVDTDKKPAWLKVIDGRGWSVRSEVVLPKKVVSTILKTTPKKLHEVWLAKCMVGSAISGSMGFNAQFANVIAALFIATGQDVAHTVEGSLGMTTVDVRHDSLFVSVHLPSVMVGTVGGGTSLATAKEALGIMRVFGAGHVAEFASVVGAAVLAGEISLLASLAEGSLARAHDRFARGKKGNK